MRQLHLLRHAKAVPQDPEHDFERGLEERGLRAAEALAQWIAAHGLKPELILCSPARRTRETLDIIARSVTPPATIRFEEWLYLANARQTLARLRKIDDDVQSLMLVGHNPGFQELALLLTDLTIGPLVAGVREGMPTAALVSLELAVPWSRLDRRLAHLKSFITPRTLRVSGA